MPPSIAVVAVAVIVGNIAIWWYKRWRRGKLTLRLTKEWGDPTPAIDWDEERASEAWREHSGEGRDGIDARTWADLDLDRILAGLDHTHTTLGRQRLYARLRSGAAWKASPKLEAFTTGLVTDGTLRLRVALTLASAGRSLGVGLWLITRPDAIRTRWWYWSFPVLALAMFGSILATFLVPKMVLMVAALVAINLSVRMATAWQVPGILGPMRQLGPLMHTAEHLAPSAGAMYEGPESVGSAIARLRPLQGVARWVGRDPMASNELAAGAWEYFNILFILDANALLFGARHLRVLGPDLIRVANWVGDVDAAYSVASLRAEPREWSIPESGGDSATRVEGAWHPMVVDAVTNDAELVPGRGMVITGANMSGKSTYLRTVGIAAVLARAINTCPATWRGESFRVRSLIGRNDDLAAGKSYYQVEADGVVALLADSRDDAPTIFLLDEGLRGTNTIERLAAGEAVLRALLATKNGVSPHVVIVATHDGELVAMLDGLYDPFHFRETIGADGLLFDYRRREGPASTRTAIALLEATGAPPEVIQAARARAKELDG